MSDASKAKSKSGSISSSNGSRLKGPVSLTANAPPSTDPQMQNAIARLDLLGSVVSSSLDEYRDLQLAYATRKAEINQTWTLSRISALHSLCEALLLEICSLAETVQISQDHVNTWYTTKLNHLMNDMYKMQTPPETKKSARSGVECVESGPDPQKPSPAKKSQESAMKNRQRLQFIANSLRNRAADSTKLVLELVRWCDDPRAYNPSIAADVISCVVTAAEVAHENVWPEEAKMHVCQLLMCVLKCANRVKRELINQLSVHVSKFRKYSRELAILADALELNIDTAPQSQKRSLKGEEADSSQPKKSRLDIPKNSSVSGSKPTSRTTSTAKPENSAATAIKSTKKSKATVSDDEDEHDDEDVEYDNPEAAQEADEDCSNGEDRADDFEAVDSSGGKQVRKAARSTLSQQPSKSAAPQTHQSQSRSLAIPKVDNFSYTSMQCTEPQPVLMPTKGPQSKFFRVKADRPSSKFSFDITSKVWTMLEEGKIKLWIKSFKDEDPDAVLPWPKEITVVLNGTSVSTAKMNNPDWGVDLINQVKEGANQLVLNYSNAVHYSFTICTLAYNDLKEFVNAMPCRTIEEVFDTVQEKGQTLRFSPIDPVSNSLIHVAARGRDCTHLQCFDAVFYLNSNQYTQRWQCPVCKAEVLPKNLCREKYCESPLNSLR